MSGSFMNPAELGELISREGAKRKASTDEAMREVFHRMPWGVEFTMASGVTGSLKKLGDVGEKDGEPVFYFDVVFSDGGHLEFMVNRTGWGSPVNSVEASK